MLSKESPGLRQILVRAVGPDKADLCLQAILGEPSVSVRINPSKVDSPEDFVRRQFGPLCERVPWNPLGFFLPARPVFTLDPLFHAGCYYVQDSSAMAPGRVFREVLDRFPAEGRPLRILDLCAAPGGKTTDLAASTRERLGDNFVLVANEVMKGRAAVLSDNVAIWGDPCVVVTSRDPSAFGSLEDYFDIIVADVPCSGEGMFRKDDEALEDWSEDIVNLCAQRQRRILSDVWPSLRPGGALIYSTCTFEPSENDGNLLWAAETLGGEILRSDWSGFPGVLPTCAGALFVPGLVRGEGQFAGALIKNGEWSEGKSVSLSLGGQERRGDLLVRMSASLSSEYSSLKALHPLLYGVAQGTLKGKDLVPDADLALSLSLENDSFSRVEVDKRTALTFLRRDSFCLPGAPKGFVLICYESHPLGFVKNLGNRCNNLHPSGRRIRMNIPESL